MPTIRMTQADFDSLLRQHPDIVVGPTMAEGLANLGAAVPAPRPTTPAPNAPAVTDIPRARAVNQPTPGQPNKTEAAYARLLDERIRAGEVLLYLFEPIAFRLADRCRYTPDYLVVMADGTIEFHEVKGPWVEEDAAIKFRVVRERYRMFRFRAMQKTKIDGLSTWVEIIKENQPRTKRKEKA